MNTECKIEIAGKSIEISVDSKDSPIVIRHFAKHIKRDLEIRNLSVTTSFEESQ